MEWWWRTFFAHLLPSSCTSQCVNRLHAVHMSMVSKYAMTSGVLLGKQTTPSDRSSAASTLRRMSRCVQAEGHLLALRRFRTSSAGANGARPGGEGQPAASGVVLAGKPTSLAASAVLHEELQALL